MNINIPNPINKDCGRNMKDSPKDIPQRIMCFCDNFSLIIPELSLVVLNENRPYGISIVTKTGKFNAIIEVPRDGYYSVGLINYVKTYNAPENRLIAKTG